MKLDEVLKSGNYSGTITYRFSDLVEDGETVTVADMIDRNMNSAELVDWELIDWEIEGGR